MLYFLCLLHIAVICVTQSQNTTITIFAISNLNAIAGASAVGAQWLAIQEINNNSELLPEITLELKGIFKHSFRPTTYNIK